MVDNLTPGAQKLLQKATELAERMGHPTVREEHILLAMTESRHTVPIAALNALGVTDALHAKILSIMNSDGYSRPSNAAVVFDRDGNVLAKGFLGPERQSGSVRLVDEAGEAADCPGRQKPN